MGLDVKEMQDCIGRVFKPFITSSCVFVMKHPVVLGILLSFFLLFMFLPSVFTFLICFIPILIFIIVSFSLIFHIHQQNLKHAKGENRDCEFSSQKTTCIEVDPKVYKRAKSVRRRKIRANAGQVLQDSVDEKGMVFSTISNDSLVDKAAVTDENPKEIREVKLVSAIDHAESSYAAFQQSRAECGDGSEARTNKLNGGGAELERESSEDEEVPREDGSKAVEWTEDDQKNLMDFGISEMERNTRVESLMARHRAKPIEWTEDDQKNLTDLGISEMERNAKVESLMAKHRAKPIEWTEDDQRNLTDLGISEMERNARVESLMAKHRAKPIEWTEDDQKNLMDLGISEIERNRRLEGLIAKRKARKLLSLQVRRTLMNMGNNDPRGHMVSVLIPKNNPFLPNTSSDSQTSRTPGSAPPILLPMHNPFDLPYDPQEEKPNLRGDSFEEEFMAANQKDMTFCRHESFRSGTYAPPPWEFDHGQHETFDRSNLANGQRDLEIPKWSRSRNQSGKEDPSQASEQVFNLPDDVEDKNEVHTEPSLVEEVTDGSESSSEINVPFTAASKDEILRTLSFSVRKKIAVDGEHNAPLYERFPSFIERKSREEPFFYAHNGVDYTPSHSIASDLLVEVSEVSSAEVTVDGPNSSSDSESPMTDNNGDVDVEKKMASGGEELWVAPSTQLATVEENESKSRGVREVSDQDIMEVGFSRFSQTSENPISLDMLLAKVVEQDPICTDVSSSRTGSPKSSGTHSVDFSGKAYDQVPPPSATHSLEALSTDNLASPPLENAQKSTEKSEPRPAYCVDSQKPEEPSNSPRKSTEADIVDNNIYGSVGNENEEKENSKSVEDGEGQPELLIKEKALTDPMEPPSDITSVEGPGDSLKPLTDKKEDKVNSKSVEDGEGQPELLIEEKALADPMEPPFDITSVEGPGDGGLKPLTDKKEEKENSKSVEDGEGQPELLIKEKALTDPMEPPSDITSVEGPGDSVKPLTDKKEDKVNSKSVEDGEGQPELLIKEKAFTNPMEPPSDSTSIEGPGDGLKPLTDNGADIGNLKSIEENENSGTTERIEEFGESMKSKDVGGPPLPTNTKDNLDASKVFDDKSKNLTVNEADLVGLTKPVEQNDNSNIPATYEEIEEPPKVDLGRPTGEANISSNGNELAVNAMDEKDDSRSGAGDSEIESQRLKQSENSVTDDSNTIENVDGKASISSKENELAVNAMDGKDDSRSGVGDSEIESQSLKQSENSEMDDSSTIENVGGKTYISSNENELAVDAMVGKDDSRSGVGDIEIESQRLKQSENSEMDDSSTIEDVEGNPTN